MDGTPVPAIRRHFLDAIVPGRQMRSEGLEIRALRKAPLHRDHRDGHLRLGRGRGRQRSRGGPRRFADVCDPLTLCEGAVAGEPVLRHIDRRIRAGRRKRLCRIGDLGDRRSRLGRSRLGRTGGIRGFHRLAVAGEQDRRQIVEVLCLEEGRRRDGDREMAGDARHYLGDRDGVDAEIGEVFRRIELVLRDAQGLGGQPVHVFCKPGGQRRRRGRLVHAITLRPARGGARTGALDQLLFELPRHARLQVLGPPVVGHRAGISVSS